MKNDTLWLIFHSLVIGNRKMYFSQVRRLILLPLQIRLSSPWYWSECCRACSPFMAENRAYSFSFLYALTLLLYSILTDTIDYANCLSRLASCMFIYFPHYFRKSPMTEFPANKYMNASIFR